jgi:hypothetical protein
MALMRNAVLRQPGPDGEGTNRARITQITQLEEVFQAALLDPSIRLHGPLHARSQAGPPQIADNVGVDHQRQLAAEDVAEIVGKSFEAGTVIGVEVRDENAVEAVEIELDVGRLGGFGQHLANGMRAIDEQPTFAGDNGEAGRVIARGERIADAGHHDAEAVHLLVVL